jgi:hypothetical protein
MILAGQSCREGATAITEVTVLDTNLTHIVGFDITVEVFAAGSDSVLGVKEILELITVSQDTTLKLDITVRVDLPKPVHDTTFVTDTLRCYQRRGESWNYACVKEH